MPLPDDVRAAWLSVLTCAEPAGQVSAEGALRVLYGADGRELGPVVWLDSPIAAAWAVALLTAPHHFGEGAVGARTLLGVNVRQQYAGGRVLGSFSCRDYTRNLSVRSTTVSKITTTGTSAIVEGTCLVETQPCTFKATPTDGGPSVSDRLVLEVSGQPRIGGAFTSGSLRVTIPTASSR